MVVAREQIVKEIHSLLGVEIMWSVDGPPVFPNELLPDVKWPRKISTEATVVLDPSSITSKFCWPLPRFEILVANLESIGFVVACSERTSEGESIKRAQWDISREKSAQKKAAVIKRARLWVGHDTIWRYIAAAVGTPQIVIAGDQPVSGEIFSSTTIVAAIDTPAESLALGPISVKQVSEAIVNVLRKQRAH